LISVILPTYNEAPNIAPAVSAIEAVFRENRMDGEIIVVDDDSPDGTAEIAGRLAGGYPIRIHVRKGPRGLSRAVMDGFEIAQGEVCVVMDADLSHPVDRIPAMVRPILDGACDITVGSRNIPGGGAEHWPFFRRLVSRAAGFLARGVTSLSDPTSGFMAIRRSKLEGVRLDPLGWKIVLEAVVKTGAKVVEVPIVFSDRRFGRSKLNARVEWDYLRQLGRLYASRYLCRGRSPGPNRP